jgi:MerR family copper efflux transcriptional regulator
VRAELTVGQLAKLTSLTTVTIRYYERCGLLPKAVRSAGGYRTYSDDIIYRLRFIKNAKSLGFSLEEIQELLSSQIVHSTSPQDVKALTLAKLTLIRAKITSLKQIEQALENLTSRCNGKGALHDCPILKALYESPSACSSSNEESTDDKSS